MNKQNDWLPFAGLVGRCRLILAVDWDPLGVFGYPGALGEYDRYAIEVAELLKDGANAQAVAEYLSYVQRERMEMLIDERRLKWVVARLIRLTSQN